MPASVTRQLERPRGILWSVVAALALAVALVVIPFPAASAWSRRGYGSRAALVDALSAGFVSFWRTGTGAIPADLAAPVDFWARFHVVKAGIAAVLVVVLVLLGSRAWAARTSRGGVARLVTGASAAAAWLASLVALVVLVANVQGALAPLSSALGLLPIGAPDPVLGDTLSQVHDGVATDLGDPSVGALISDFAAYHRIMAGLGALVAAALVVAATLLWRERRRLPAGSRRGRAPLVAAICALLAVAGFFAVVGAANLGTSARPAPALQSFFEGGL